MSQSSAKKKSVPALGTSSTNKKQMTLMSFFSSPANGGGDSAKKAPTVKSSPLGAPETTPLARRASVPQKTPLAKEPFTSPFPVTSAKASGCSPSVRSVGAGVKRQRAIQDSDSENEEPLVGTGMPMRLTWSSMV